MTRCHGSVLIIVLWIAFGLVALALYFAQSMLFQLRAVDQRVAGTQAEQAIAGATYYVSNVLASVETPGTWPEVELKAWEAVPIGNATFWLIGRGTPRLEGEPVFDLADEGSKLNLNTATQEMLELLPGMTAELAAAIMDWRDTDDDVTTGGAETDTYQRFRPGYRCKNGPFESVEELRLVAGMTLDILYGEDANLNGVLDPNEDDGDASPPADNHDGELDPGLIEYLTIDSRESGTRSDGSARVNVASSSQQELQTLLQEQFGEDRAKTILSQVGTNNSNIGSLLAFYVKSGMTVDEFSQIEGDLTVSTNSSQAGLINVNTASEAVLACVPGIGTDLAPTLFARRQNGATALPTVAWVAEALDQTNIVQAGPYLTSRSYQYTVDLAAVGRFGRGYRRVRWLCDTADGTPKFIRREDLTHLGWALGPDARDPALFADRTR
jgi:type II secretory pathway component PulK